LKKDYDKASEMQKATAVDFAQLLEMCSHCFQRCELDFLLLIRKTCMKSIIEVIAKHHNICNHIHLPVQSGSTRILKEMNRQHTREEYMALIDKIIRLFQIVIVTRYDCWFPTETEEDHQDTLSLMEYVKYDFGFMFAYSERPGTLAARKMEDDVPEEVKKRRLKKL
jgi:tRNA-2-methylthio-N6-dimethylallyladenosine synthase